MWGAFSDERMGLSFKTAAGPCQRSHIYRGQSSTCHLHLQFYMSAFYIVSCQESGSLWIPAIYNFTCNSSIYVQHIEGLCQSRLGREDHVSYLSYATTAAL
jgi:hypothetical protein